MKRTKLIILAVAALAVIAFGLAAAQQKPAKAPATAATATTTMKFEAVEPQTRKFIEYYKTIRLTPEQEKIKAAALSPLRGRRGASVSRGSMTLSLADGLAKTRDPPARQYPNEEHAANTPPQDAADGPLPRQSPRPPAGVAD